MLSAIVTSEDLLANPDYPFIPHIPIERLRLDTRNLPPQRRKRRNRTDTVGRPICLAGDHPVRGDALFCETCRAESRNLAQQRRRLARKPDVTISKTVLSRVHDSIDSLSPLLTNLTTAYNTGGDLRDETDAVMRRFKWLQREIRDLLPDPRDDRATND